MSPLREIGRIATDEEAERLVAAIDSEPPEAGGAAKPALGILLSHPANRVATIGAMHPGAMSAMMRG